MTLTSTGGGLFLLALDRAFRLVLAQWTGTSLIMRGGGIARTLDSLLTQLQEDLQDAPEFLKDVTVKIVLPVVAGLAATLVCVRASRMLLRQVFPPSAEALHQEALGVFKKGQDDVSRELARRLLLKSIKKDPKYLSSYLTLAALQLYEEESPEESLETLDRGLSKFPKDRELNQMRLDALAMQQNLSHMVKVGSFGSTHLGAIGWKPSEAPNNKKSARYGSVQ